MILSRRALCLAAPFLGALLPALPALGQDRPPTLPMRDVDITYTIPTPAGAARQRLRYSVAHRALRIDPPGAGLYIVIDFAAGRMFTVRDTDRSVIDMAAPRAWMPGQGNGRYTRRNATTVSGVPCTEWQTTDSEGRDVRICFDDQGDMLRASVHTPRGEIVLALATELRHETQGRTIFHIPPDYRRLSPPPIPGAR
jgi:hypothetical protein